MPNLALRRLAPLLVLLGLVAGACSSVTGNPAVTVSGSEINQDELQDELELIRENRQYRQVLEQQYGVALTGAGKGTFSAAFTAQALSLRVYYELLEQDLADEGVEITDADVERAQEGIEQQIESLGEGVLRRFPRAYRRQLARQEALVAKASELASEQIERAEVEIACVSHILFATEQHSPEEALALARTAKADLDAGAEFAEVARERSEDPGSGAQGGELGCNPPGAFVEAFDEAAFSLPVGEVSDPVQTDFGYHLVLVTERELGPDPRDQGGQQALNAYLLELVCDADLDIDVNPKYGRWDRSPCDEGGIARVAPPRTSTGS